MQTGLESHRTFLETGSKWGLRAINKKVRDKNAEEFICDMSEMGREESPFKSRKRSPSSLSTMLVILRQNTWKKKKGPMVISLRKCLEGGEDYFGPNSNQGLPPDVSSYQGTVRLLWAVMSPPVRELGLLGEKCLGVIFLMLLLTALISRPYWAPPPFLVYERLRFEEKLREARISGKIWAQWGRDQKTSFANQDWPFLLAIHLSKVLMKKDGLMTVR